jgi:preprotein translocase subunit SecG
MIQDPERRGRDSKLDIITTIMCFFFYLLALKLKLKMAKKRVKLLGNKTNPRGMNW